jgi:hypothetical protein
MCAMSVKHVIPSDIGKRFADALGIPFDGLREIHLHIEPDSIPWVETHVVATLDQLDRLVDVVKDY